MTYEYLAGIVDGEGCLMITRLRRVKDAKRGIRYSPVMTIANTNIPLLESIQTNFGGIIREEHTGTYALYFSANEIRELLPKFRQFLIVKGNQADILLQYLSKIQENGYQPISDELFEFYTSCYEKLRAMKKVRYSYDQSPKPIKDSVCQVCGNRFVVYSTHPHKKFCSASCKTKDCWTRSNQRIRSLKITGM